MDIYNFTKCKDGYTLIGILSQSRTRPIKHGMRLKIEKYTEFFIHQKMFETARYKNVMV
jgi:hypothetical protein